MPARDFYHAHVVDALVRDGWTITHDPLAVRVGAKDMFIDLGAERFLAAEKAGRKIAVEVKSFLGPSEVRDLEVTLGQFVLYTDALAVTQPERTLYVALRIEIYEDLFTEPLGALLLRNGRLRLVVFDSDRREVVKWIP